MPDPAYLQTVSQMFWPGLSTYYQRGGEHGYYIMADSLTYLLRDKCMKVNASIGGY